MSATSGARVIVLINRLQVSRNALKAALTALTDLDLVERNPGYGHPLRPEYRLTTKGQSIAPAAASYTALMTDRPSGRLKWSAPILNGLLKLNRFNALQQALGITPRAMTQTLKSLESDGLVSRSIDDGYPPRSHYELTRPGRVRAAEVAVIAAELDP